MKYTPAKKYYTFEDTPAKKYYTFEEEKKELYTPYTSNGMSWADIVIECFGYRYWVKCCVINSHRKFLKLLEDLWYMAT